MSMDSWTGDRPQIPPQGNAGDPQACERCAAPVELLTALPRRIGHSAFRIFVCTSCNFLQWLPD
jgi:hypothetical protein